MAQIHRTTPSQSKHVTIKIWRTTRKRLRRVSAELEVDMLYLIDQLSIEAEQRTMAQKRGEA